MKKYFISIALLLSALSAYSQEETTKHLEFKGIPIDGNFKAFAQKLVGQGCRIISNDVDIIMLEGSFVSKNCTIGVVATPVSKTVWKVATILPEHDSWRTIELEYDNLKAQYTAKYGEPLNVSEFITESYLEDSKLLALQLGKCTWRSDWYVEAGYISIQMTEDKCIVIHYEDLINSELKDEETQSEI